jgi:hypothetical protein
MAVKKWLLRDDSNFCEREMQAFSCGENVYKVIVNMSKNTCAYLDLKYIAYKFNLHTCSGI